MYYFTADKIHDGHRFLPVASVLVIDEQGTIKDILPASEIDNGLIRHFEGILCPGFVNVHCHLELSHTFGMIPEATGLVPFLKAVIFNRNQISEEEKLDKIKAVALEMHRKGCVAVGDIANTTDLVLLRPDLPLHFQTFVETMGFAPGQAEARFAWSEKVYQQFAANNTSTRGYSLHQSIVPHAPYSVGPELFQLINEYNEHAIVSVHNEETAAENEYFRHKTGDMKMLYEALKIDADSFFVPSGHTSLQTYLPWVAPSHPLLLIHNTFMEKGDLEVLAASGRTVNLGLCPNANWYIERRLPDIPMLAQSGLNICLGTDSLASNHQLDVMAEINTILAHFSGFSIETLLTWASFNGARALGLMDRCGEIKAGAAPGIVFVHPSGTKYISERVL